MSDESKTVSNEAQVSIAITTAYFQLVAELVDAGVIDQQRLAQRLTNEAEKLLSSQQLKVAGNIIKIMGSNLSPQKEDPNAAK